MTTNTKIPRNELTQEWINAYIDRPQAAVLIDTAGDVQTGRQIAEELHKKIINNASSPLIILEPTKTKSIGIDDVRELQHTLSLQANISTEQSSTTRMAMVSPADALTPEAQNALLKLIEEMPARTVVCLVANQSDGLLETVRSRCFRVPVLPISEESALQYGLNDHDEAAIIRAFAMADGNTFSFIELLGTPENAEMDQAKQFLQASVFERQILLTKLQKSKSFDAKSFLSSLALIAKIAMRNTRNATSKQQWKDRLVLLLESQDMLQRNTMSKLVMLRVSILL